MPLLSPIALFVFKRPEHTARLLSSLLKNVEFSQSPLFIYCDGARRNGESKHVADVRQMVKSFPHPYKTVILAPANQGLAKSITQGVSELCERFGRVIVVEDDLVVAPNFLHYMNGSLERYADEPRVMQISGHMFPVDLQVKTDAVFMPVATSWGWATWQRAWEHMQVAPELALEKLGSPRWRYQFDLQGSFPYARMLAERLAGRNHSWAIWWYFSMFINNGIALFPTRSLVINEGFDGSGTHCGYKEIAFTALDGVRVADFPDVGIDQPAFRTYCKFLQQDRGFAKRNFDRLWRVFFSTRFCHVA